MKDWWKWQRGCRTKVRHENRKEARKTIRDLYKKEKSGGFLAPYECAFCGGWHVGHATAPKKAGETGV